MTVRMKETLPDPRVERERERNFRLGTASAINKQVILAKNYTVTYVSLKLPIRNIKTTIYCVSMLKTL
jgi:hypothetical protein